MPAYQAASTLAETLDAIMAQSFSDWECVVVDDGSTDDTLLTATAYEQRDPRFRVICQGNRGTAGAYNAGVSSAVGDFVVICSADDILLPEHLFRMSASSIPRVGTTSTLLTGTTGGRGINGICSTGSKIVRRSIRSS
jgi:glycosyltransferase involved in cell wall biosynthesis